MEDNESFSAWFLRLINACSCCCSLAEEIVEDVISRLLLSLLLLVAVVVGVVADDDEHPKLVSMFVAYCLKSAACCDVSCRTRWGPPSRLGDFIKKTILCQCCTCDVGQIGHCTYSPGW